jgi:hypothetical protein
MSSLTALKHRCETDEAGLGAKLISLQLARDENEVDVTAAHYEIADGLNLGHVIFEEFSTEVDFSSRIAIHQTRQDPLVCRGRAFIADGAKNVVVFREREDF